MFSAVFGLFSHDLAVDLGTSNTRIWQKGQGLTSSAPTVVSVHTDRRGKRSVLAVGEEALPMLGRTPGDIAAVQPVRDGQIQEYEVAEALLVHLMRRLHGRNGWLSPRLVVPVPSLATEMERRAVRECCEAAGAREVHLVPVPVAAALGAGLPVREPSGHMVVDIGGGSSEVSVVSLSGVVISRTAPGGGEGMDRAIVDWLRAHKGLVVGRPTAESLKISLASALPGPSGATGAVARGRCERTGVPRAVAITASDLQEALRPAIGAIADTIRAVLERTPPELASDVVDHGVVLTGGGALLRDLDMALRDRTGLPVVVADDPAGATVRGAGSVLDELDLLRAIAS